MDMCRHLVKSLGCPPDTINIITLSTGYQFSSVTQSCPTLWGAFREGYSWLPVELGQSQASTHQWLTSMGVSGRAPYWAEQCRLYPPKLSLGAHLPSVSCIPLLRTNGYLSYKSQMPIPEEALPASVLPALPPPQSGLGALLRAPFCRYVISCLGCSPSVQFSLVTQSCPTLCNPMDCSTPGFPVHHQLLEFTQAHVYWVSEAIQPSHPL